MAEQSQKDKHKIHVKYRISVINEDTFDEVRRVRLSVFNSILITVILLLLSGSIVLGLVFFTSLREYIPGYPNSATQTMMIDNSLQVDSLLVELKQQEAYISGIKQILIGDIPVYNDSTTSATKQHILDIAKMQASEKELEFRDSIQSEEQYNLGLFDLAAEAKLTNILLLSPVKGLITSGFDADIHHYGVDIATQEREPILAVAAGTVVLVDYSITGGNIISVQHPNNLISTYRHAASISKKIGDKISSGEVIGTVGSTGSLSTGIHLHLEIWQNGTPIDPQTLIVF